MSTNVSFREVRNDRFQLRPRSATGRELSLNTVRCRPIADIISVGESSPIAVVEGSDASGHPVTTDKFDVSKMVAMTTHRGAAGNKF